MNKSGAVGTFPKQHVTKNVKNRKYSQNQTLTSNFLK